MQFNLKWKHKFPRKTNRRFPRIANRKTNTAVCSIARRKPQNSFAKKLTFARHSHGEPPNKNHPPIVLETSASFNRRACIHVLPRPSTRLPQKRQWLRLSRFEVALNAWQRASATTALGREFKVSGTASLPPPHVRRRGWPRSDATASQVPALARDSLDMTHRLGDGNLEFAPICRSRARAPFIKPQNTERGLEVRAPWPLRFRVCVRL